MYRLFTEPQNFETRCLVTSAHLCHIPPFPPYPRRLCLPCQLLWQHHCKRVNCTSCCAHCTAELRLRRMQTNNVLRKTTSQICNCWTLSEDSVNGLYDVLLQRCSLCHHEHRRLRIQLGSSNIFSLDSTNNHTTPLLSFHRDLLQTALCSPTIQTHKNSLSFCPQWLANFTISPVTCFQGLSN